MPDAELSSLRAMMEDIRNRIVKRAEDLEADGNGDAAHDLYEVERSVVTAIRRLSKLVDIRDR